MAVALYAKNSTVGKITLSDGTGSPVTLVLPYDNGDVSIGGLSDVLNEVVVVETRGRFIDIARGKRVYPSFSFSAKELSHSGAATDFINRLADYSANVSTMGATHRVYTVDVEWHVEGTTQGDPIDDIITMTNVAITTNIDENDEQDEASFSGTVYGTVTINGITKTEVA